MKAAVLRDYGGPDVLRAETVADPVVGTGWSVVRLRAAALNWHDVLVRRGQYASPLPHVPGADGAGVVVGTGDEVIILPSLNWGSGSAAPGPGWEILGDHCRGTYAELVAVPDECLFPKPSALSWAQAAALALVGVTTYRALVSRGRLRAGETLLVVGAGGGVATQAVTLATALGAKVFVTSSSTDKLDRARALGASGGVLYTAPSWPDEVRELTGGVDVVLDPAGTWSESIRVLRPGGRLVALGASQAEVAPMEVRAFYFGQYDLLGSTMGSPRDFRSFLDLVETRRIPPPTIDRTFSLDDAAAAHRYLESGRVFGKVVLEIDA